MSSLYTRLKITLGKANADQHGIAALATDQYVDVTQGADIIMRPSGKSPTIGIILYPGGRCDPCAYAPVMRPLAAAGALVVIPNMPLRMAVLDANRAGKIMANHPDIDSWVLGGHSMGGAMAAAYAFKHQTEISGLFLLGSYASKLHAMPESELPAMMISGSHDFITRASEVNAAPERMPANTEYVVIEGGDHYQFGSFANAEHTATIERADQQQLVSAALQRFIDSIPG